jgi:hypothetical protein
VEADPPAKPAMKDGSGLFDCLSWRCCGCGVDELVVDDD